MENKLKTKDLINIGIFSVLYMLVMIAVTTIIGSIPLLYLGAPFFVPIFTASVYMILCMRVPKTGAVLILGIVFALYTLLFSIWYSLYAVAIAILAEVVLAKGKDGYKSIKNIMNSFLVFNMNMLSPSLAIVFSREKFMADTIKHYGQDYADKLAKLIPPWIIFVLAALTLIGAFLGARIGRKLLDKHFKKAGII